MQESAREQEERRKIKWMTLGEILEEEGNILRPVSTAIRCKLKVYKK